VVRHANPTRTQIRLAIEGRQVTVVVSDDGKGGAVERGGLRNLRERAEKLGGQCEVSALDPSGTELRWRVPVTDDPAA
jgi:two-component system, NarL family, sensor histidine kinase DevS